MGAYHPIGEGYVTSLCEFSKVFYDKFFKRSKEVAQSLLGNYDGGRRSEKYMKGIPSRDSKTQEYFS